MGSAGLNSMLASDSRGPKAADPDDFARSETELLDTTGGDVDRASATTSAIDRVLQSLTSTLDLRKKQEDDHVLGKVWHPLYAWYASAFTGL